MKRKFTVLLMTILMVFTLVACIDTRAEDVYVSPVTYEQIRIEMLQSVEPSVVAIQTDGGFGSGVIFNKETTATVGEYLYSVLTNYHVIEDGGEIKVYYGDETTAIPAQDYQGSMLYDIAVVRFVTSINFPALDIKPITENITTEIVLGQDVYAIGTPKDLKNFNYVTSGVVSLESQTYNGINGLAIMHDAELNPGNSGGPLFNLNGDVIAINVAKDAWIATENGDIAAEGLNFSLNINTIAPVVRGFDEEDYIDIVRAPKLGVTVVELADYLQQYPDNASFFESGAHGVVVIGFDYTRNAASVLEELDLIVAVNDTTINTVADIAGILSGAQFGDSFSVTIVRLEGTTFVTHTYDIELS